MKKKIIPKTAAFAMAAALALPVTVCAAPPTTAPIEMSVKKDGKTHNVYVFGQSLALISTDGSIEISCMGSVGRVDVPSGDDKKVSGGDKEEEKDKEDGDGETEG